VLPTPVSILDIGCGTGALMKELAVYGTVSGVDFSDTAIAFCRDRGLTSVQKSDVRQLSFAANTFDVVLALDVLEHVPNDAHAISEILRVLKPSGVLIVFVPAFMSLWGITDIISQHYRRYRLPELVALFKNHNTRLLRKSYFNTFLFLPIATIRFVTRICNIHMDSENYVGGTITNSLCYLIFNCERILLRWVTLPFGVSCYVVIQKIVNSTGY
jgi:ubiquinone/menaquinone biosynthesis C-methylase UbiE